MGESKFSKFQNIIYGGDMLAIIGFPGIVFHIDGMSIFVCVNSYYSKTYHFHLIFILYNGLRYYKLRHIFSVIILI